MTGGPPNIGSAASGAYDVDRHQVVVFGGNAAACCVPSSQTWVWSAGTWTQKFPVTHPPGVNYGAAAWDPALHEVVLFGGNQGSVLRNESNALWAWNGSNWAALSPTGTKPAARDGASLVWDPVQAGLVMFGGADGTFEYNETWLFKANAWILLQAQGVSGAPIGRTHQQLAYSTSTSQLLLFGGEWNTTGPYTPVSLSDTWTFTESTKKWVRQTPAGFPPARAYAMMAYDPGLGAVVVFGGAQYSASGSLTFLNSTWAWNGSTWLLASGIAAPSGRAAAAVAATDSGQLLVVGGSGSAIGETWIYDTSLPILGVSITNGAGGTSPLYYSGDAVTVSVTAQNSGILTDSGFSITSAVLPNTLQPAGSLVSWAGTALGQCPASTNPCGIGSDLIATASNLSLGAGLTKIASFVATVVGSQRGCSQITVPAVAASVFGSTTGYGTNTIVCGGGLGMENWYSYDRTDLGAGGAANVNVANGNLVVQQQDSTQIPVHGDLGFSLNRAYNSQDNMAISGPLGAGWQFDIGETGAAASGGVDLGGLQIPSLQSILSPLSVTYIDRDGTRQVFKQRSAAAQIAGLNLPIDLGNLQGSLAKLLDPATLPFALSGTGYGAACIDVTYSPPAGVDEYLWRYVGVASASCSSAAITSSAVTLGWTVMRPDRVRYDFDASGRLMDIVDATGNKLVYKFDGSGQLVSVYSAACVPAGSPSSSGGPACGQYSITYTTTTIAGTSYKKIDETDPAGETTTFIVSQGTLPELLQVWNPDDPFSTATGTAPSITYSYSTASTPCPGSAAHTITVGALCSATDPNANTTRFAYTPAPIGPDRVLSATDRRANASGGATTGNEVLYTYNDASSYVTADSAAPATFGAASPPTGCVGKATCERTRYQGIDNAGRVAEIDAGDASDTYLRQKGFFWDTSSASSPLTCRQPDQVVDNNLCQSITRAVPSAAPFTLNGVSTTSVNGVTVSDQATRYVYGDLGQVLRTDQVVDPAIAWTGANSHITTYGDHEQYFQADGSVGGFDDAVAGGGVVTSSAGAGGKYPGAVTADNPVAYYRLNELSGSTAKDASGAGQDAAYGSGVPLGAPGAIPGDPSVGETGAAWTASVTQLANFASGPPGAGSAFTVESWAKTTNTGIEYTACSPCGSTGMVLGRYTGGLPWAYLATPAGGVINVVATSSVTDGAWHQVDYSYDGSGHAAGVKIYIDGAPVATTIYGDTLGTGTVTPANSAMYLGDNTAGTTGDGTALDELSLYPAALSANRIAAHHKAALSSTRLDLSTLYAVNDQTEMLPPRGNSTAQRGVTT